MYPLCLLTTHTRPHAPQQQCTTLLGPPTDDKQHAHRDSNVNARRTHYTHQHVPTVPANNAHPSTRTAAAVHHTPRPSHRRQTTRAQRFQRERAAHPLHAPTCTHCACQQRTPVHTHR